MTAFGRVTEIWRYPVSSMSGELLTEALVDAGGLEHDRLWGVVERDSGEIADPEKRKQWRPLPELFSRMGEQAPEIGDGKDMWFPVASPEAEEFASRHLDFPAAFRPHTPHATQSDGKVAPRYARSDIHLLTTASMRELGSLLPDPTEIQPRRFRPNIVVETEPGFEGFVEHRILGGTLTIGSGTIALTEICKRCTFTALAQGDLAFEPAVLHRIAQHGDGGFGALCRVETSAIIRVGDRVSLLEA